MKVIFTKINLVYLLVLAIIFLLLYFILPVSLPLIFAFITASLLNPACLKLEQILKIKHRTAVITVFLIFVLLLSLVGYFVTTKVITEAVKTVNHAPQYINDVTRSWHKMQKSYISASRDLPVEIVREISSQVESFLNNLKADLLTYLNINNLKVILTNIPNYLVNFLVYLIALFLFLLELPALKLKTYNHLSEKTAEKVSFMTSRLSYVVVGFFKAQFMVSVIIFIVSLIGLIIICPDTALVVSLVIWGIDFIPILGSILILGPWSLYEFAIGDVSTGTQLAILAAILLIIRRTVEPKVMGRHIGLSPLSTLIAMYLGMKVVGILGFIVGPLLLIIYTTAKEAGIIKVKFKI
ncbi:sporulation integral membrane protein YtvI [Neobacillus terrae]|uniref:sporulation integral membrane protein YtvI n=1 Tax=Neobacillus terrae TaxID=3034837 RepID=UPI00140CC2FB|nr:sporulation integral membrane protein YtvI [Neobacillus terrae]NHM29661.1 sporulation integral membrane protein YtvI [Neobacillus terrae]